MNRFNLTFKGEILPGRKAEQVKPRFGKMFAIDDPDRLERFFSGKTIILRRNLDRKTAAEYFQKLRKLGVEVELVKVTAQDRAATITKAPPPPAEIEEAARREEAERKATEEAERQQAEEAAREEALRKEAERKAAEEAERRQVELAEKKRREEEEAARQRALREEEERRAAEEAARQQSELAEKKRIEEEEAERQRALREEAERKAAEEAARQKAEKAERKRKAAEEAARLKAEEQRKKAEERARLKAQRAEEAARKKALKEEARRVAAEEAARRKAELQRKKKLREEARRKATEEQARRSAELAEKKRIEAEEAAEEVAREQAILKEAKRKAAKEAAREQAILDEAKRKAAAEIAKLKAEQKKVAREAAERVARLRAEQEEVARKAAEEVARIEADEQAAQHKAMEEQAVQRAAAALAQQPSLKPVKARVKTTLEVPQRKSNREGQPSAIAPRRRQPGAPNLYSLRPFRNTPEVRARAEQSLARMRVGFIAAALALAGLLLLGGRFVTLPTAPAITGAGAMAIDGQAGLLLLAGDSLLFHDRSGVGTRTLQWESLGLTVLQAPMAFDTAGELLALGQLKTAGTETDDVDSLQLLRCNLAKSLCRPFSTELASSSIAGFAIHQLDGTIFLADAANGQLLKASADGTVLARAPAAIPDNPVLRLESGLLFMNSALGPAVSVFRYDDGAFGQQLDEILLLPPAAIETEQSRVGDFVWSADNWWASMYNPQTNSAGLYRFDAQWNFIEQAQLPGDTWPRQLATWGDKTLVRDAHHIAIQRFNASGAPEAPLVSDLLESLVARQQHSTSLTGMAWRASLTLCALVSIAGLSLGSLQRLRGLVYKPHQERGADPVDEHVDAVDWIDPVTDRRAQLRRTTISYAVIALALLLLAMARHVAPMQLAAILIALSGPPIALLLLGRNSAGHIGILQEQLLLVDHRGMYHLGGGPRVQYRGPFVLLDDVVVFTGTRLLPAFSSKQVTREVTPLAKAGIRVDRKTVIVKLLQSGHPLAQGAIAVLVSFTAAAALLYVQGIF